MFRKLDSLPCAGRIFKLILPNIARGESMAKYKEWNEFYEKDCEIMFWKLTNEVAMKQLQEAI